MNISVRKYIKHTVYVLHVSATHVAIFGQVYYKVKEKNEILKVIFLLFLKFNVLCLYIGSKISVIFRCVYLCNAAP
jgi:hypothetical protein